MVLGLGLLLATGSNDAGAAAFGGVAGSAGLLAALTTLVLMQGWAAHLAAPGVYAGGALLVAGALAGWWGVHHLRRVVAFAFSPSRRRPAGSSRVSTPSPRPTALIGLPAGIEPDRLLADLRLLFVRVQEAWDRAETASLRMLTTPQMFDELCAEARCAGSVRGSTRTDVVTLRSELLGFDELAGQRLVSVEFSGLIREAADQGAVPFLEIWILAQSNAGDPGWRLARHQALL